MNIITQLQALYPDIKFTTGLEFVWSPAKQTVYYIKSESQTKKGSHSLLHELGHALLNHTTYTYDIELLRFELEAWEQAKQIAKQLDIPVDKDIIEDCLDTYRDWLHKRSICPICTTSSLQESATTYTCHNCHNKWTVSNERFCRSYRKLKTPSV